MSMLSAQCNKLGPLSPPLSAFGGGSGSNGRKSFHPWKKMAEMAAASAGTVNHHHHHFHQFSPNAATQGRHDRNFAAFPHHQRTPTTFPSCAVACGNTLLHPSNVPGSGTVTGKESGAGGNTYWSGPAAGINPVYASRWPPASGGGVTNPSTTYDSWAAMSGLPVIESNTSGLGHCYVKQELMASNISGSSAAVPPSATSSAWWGMHPPGAASTGGGHHNWGVASHQDYQQSNNIPALPHYINGFPACSVGPTDYASALDSFAVAAGSSSAFVTPPQHFMNESCYKSVLPVMTAAGFGANGFLHAAAAAAGAGAMGAHCVSGSTGSGFGVSPRSQRRYTGRSTCDCPNCLEADRLGPAGAHLRKRNVHTCHMPGCGKVCKPGKIRNIFIALHLGTFIE